MPEYWLGSAPDPLPIDPYSQQEVRAAIDKGVRYLLDYQLDNGSFGTSNPKYVRFDMPSAEHASFKMATTGLCVKALIETDDGSPEVDAAIGRGRDWMFEHLPRFARPRMRTMFNIWGHTYAMEAMLAILERDGLTDDHRQQARDLVDRQIELLTVYRTLRGGWGYYPFSPHTRPANHFGATFMTAATIIALLDAREAGFEVPDRTFVAAVRGLQQMRSPDGSFGYWIRYRTEWLMEANRGPGAMSRVQSCNAALHMYGDPRIDTDVIEAWSKRYIARNGWLSMARKNVYPHSSHFMVAGYYYYFSAYYAALCINMLPDDVEPFYQDQLAKILIEVQDGDGSWWDFTTVDYQHGYGTAYAIMALQRTMHD